MSKKNTEAEGIIPDEDVLSEEDFASNSNIPTAEELQEEFSYLAQRLAELTRTDAKKIWKASKCLRRYQEFINVD